MFTEEAAWLRSALDQIPVQEGTTVLDVGAQTREFRTVSQPHIDRDIYRPLLARGAKITSLDLQAAEGVDVIADVTAEDFDPASVGSFEVVICSNLLEHVTNRPTTIAHLGQLADDGGHLVITVPAHFPYHEDPIDTLYRPGIKQLIGDVTAAAPSLRPAITKTVHIFQREDYGGHLEPIRLAFAPMRWKVSVVIFQRAATGSS